MTQSNSVSGDSGFQVGDDAPTHYQARVEKFMAPFVSVVVAAAVSSGDSVLDVACGTGFATRAAARVVGTSGNVVGSDLNQGMLTMARSVPFEGIDISWRQASALDLPYADGEFDAVLCAQGVQFFPSPSSGLREMARVLRSGGRMAVTMWDEIEQNPFFAAEVDMLVRYCDVEPDAWSSGFAEGRTQIESWFEAAGLARVDVELIEVTVSLPPPAIYIPQHLKALPWPSRFFKVSDATRAEAIAHVEARLADYRTGAGVEVPFRSYLASVTA